MTVPQSNWFNCPQRSTRIKFGAEGMSGPGLCRGQRDFQGAFRRGERIFEKRSGRMRTVDKISKKMRDPNQGISVD